MKKFIAIFSLLIIFISVNGQKPLAESYRAYIVRQDNAPVVFTIRVEKEEGQTVFYIINADEKIKISDVKVTNDSVNFSMPVFESSFASKRNGDGSLEGIWTKGTSKDFQHWKFFADPKLPYRFERNRGPANNNITGKWDVTITRANGTQRKAVAEFVQNDDNVMGSFITPTGDYRYLDGVVTGDSLILSTFDGAHAYSFSALVENAENISSGVFLSGYDGKETWTAVKSDTVKAPAQESPTRLKKGESKLNFSFKDLDGKTVSINDERFKNKVVVVQLMGSWCPNCMDETKFLSDFYNANRKKGLEIVSLAYEYSTDWDRSAKSLKKFQKAFDVQYPMLITGVTAGDEQKTEKTLPQLTPIQSFPTSIFLDRKGNVRDIHPVFYGPGTKKYFEVYTKVFAEIVDELLKEK